MIQKILLLCFCAILQSSGYLPRYEPEVPYGICSMFSSGHIMPFSMKTFNFIGNCNYLFTEDCSSRQPQFSIWVRTTKTGLIEYSSILLRGGEIINNNGTVSISITQSSIQFQSATVQIQNYDYMHHIIIDFPDNEVNVYWMFGNHLPLNQIVVSIKYKPKFHTCGICGSLGNSSQASKLADKKLRPIFALPKNAPPQTVCLPVVPMPTKSCTQYLSNCTTLIDGITSDSKVDIKLYTILCQEDLCECETKGNPSCACATLTDFSLRNSIAKADVNNWRRDDFCSLGWCPADKVYKENESPCFPTCSNPGYSCNSHNIFGCFCTNGTIFDDISGTNKCIPAPECPCLFHGEIYRDGDITQTPCRKCVCEQGNWQCVEKACPGSCSIEGGSFVTTFDGRRYRFHGSCVYLLAQMTCGTHSLTVDGDFASSSCSSTATALQRIIFKTLKDTITVEKNSEVQIDGLTRALPYYADEIEIVKESSASIRVSFSFGVSAYIKLHGVLSAYIFVPQTACDTVGLCGTFNNDVSDDFLTSSGIIEGVASSFVDSWRLATCLPSTDNLVDPCSRSYNNKLYALKSCSILLNKASAFSKCHAFVDPADHYQRCLYQACTYCDIHAFTCDALRAYAQECAFKGLTLYKWRDAAKCPFVCTKTNMVFTYDANLSNASCLYLPSTSSNPNSYDFPVEGCVCKAGYYLDHEDNCVEKRRCPCLLPNGSILASNRSKIIGEEECTCSYGNLTCQPVIFLNIGGKCIASQYYYQCPAPPQSGEYGAACQSTCQIQLPGVKCHASTCKSGCVCPSGLYLNEETECVKPNECSCMFAGEYFRNGMTMTSGCQQCKCRGGKWDCRLNSRCPGTCVLYESGTVFTFDGKQYVFNGVCTYTLLQDRCVGVGKRSSIHMKVQRSIHSRSGSISTTAVWIELRQCTIEIRGKDQIFITSYAHNCAQIFKNNISTIVFVETDHFHVNVIIYDLLTIIIKVSRLTQHKLCGLCGNFNGLMKDDLITSSGTLEGSTIAFTNSWKNDPLCADATDVEEPCKDNPDRLAWVEKQCAVILSDVFVPCHSRVYSHTYYHACVRDACGCDAGGDCNCLCAAIAVYAKACLDAGVCIDWRTPDLCPVYCDYYNQHSASGRLYSKKRRNEDHCIWHYRPCQCSHYKSVSFENTEGCYRCEKDEYFDHVRNRCTPCVKMNVPPRKQTIKGMTGLYLLIKPIRYIPFVS
ncbi:mucin-6-like [Protopterus annectens]|uniref:mucin-6-like n=1 Tax=Protopterus annectens TaxID=7888 RepID=UPI001CFB0CAB|nr:mucin-6-like [Protopterus annectens]